MDGLPPTTLIDEALPSTQIDELILFTHTSPTLQLRWTGSHLLLLLTKLFPKLRWTSSYYTLLLALRCNLDGQALTNNSYRRSSSLNSDGRAPTIHTDEPFAATKMDGLSPTTHIDELFPQPRWTSSNYSH